MDKDLDEYKAYLEKQSNSGKVSSYLIVIKRIGGIVNKIAGFNYVPDDFSSIRNLDLLWKVYTLVKAEQKKPDGGFFNGSSLGPSYWDSRHGFCSAAVKSFLDFRIETYDGPISHDDADNAKRNDNLLSVALKLFQEKRHEPEWRNHVEQEGGLEAHTWGQGGIDDIEEMSIDDFKHDALAKMWAYEHGGARQWGQLNDNGKAEYKSFIAGIQRSLKPFGEYFPTSTECPGGMGDGMLCEFLMRFWPESCCSYNEMIWNGFVFLGLRNGKCNKLLSGYVYQEFMGMCAHVLLRIKEMGLGRTPNQSDTNIPNYLTVNEFFWFVHDKKTLIEQEILEAKRMNDKKQMKEIDEPLTARTGKGLTFTKEDNNDLLMLRLMAALRAKPFVILAGHSGTGKSRLVRKLAYMTCNVDMLWDEKKGPQNFKMIQVKPNWHDSSDLLGYRSAIKDNKYVGSELVKFIFRAYTYPQTPFFLCLDEMNLAPVEQCFAEFLSAMESMRPAKKDDAEGTGDFVSDPVIDLNVSDDAPNKDANLFELGCESKRAYQWVKDHGFTIPKNLFVIGTVNMDESTNQFSRKVLDRAMTIEMTEASFADYGKVGEPCKEDFIGNELIAKLVNRPVRVAKLVEDGEDIKKVHPGLVEVQECLKNTPFAVAFRFANEYALYKKALEVFDASHVMECNPLDHAVLMKVLPRIVGEAEDVAEIYCGSRDPKDAKNAKDGSLLGILKEETMLSNAKMKEILGRKSTYLTFWP